MKRKWRILLMLAAMAAALVFGAAADGLEIVSYTKEVTVSPEYGTAGTVSWTTNEPALKSQIVFEYVDYSDGNPLGTWKTRVITELDPTRTEYRLTYSTVEDAYRQLPANTETYRWGIRCFFGTGPEDCVQKAFKINQIPRKVTLSEGTVTVEPKVSGEISWSTNFEPKKVRLVYSWLDPDDGFLLAEDYDYKTVKELPGYQTSCQLTFSEAEKAMDVPSDARDRRWEIRAYYGSGSKDCVRAVVDMNISSYRVTGIEDFFTVDPEGSAPIEWNANFDPVKIQIGYEYHIPGSGKFLDFGEYKFVPVVSLQSGPMNRYDLTYGEAEKPGKDPDARWRDSWWIVRAFYGSGKNDYTEDSFRVNLTPRTLTCDRDYYMIGEGGGAQIRWTANYTATRFELVYDTWDGVMTHDFVRSVAGTWPANTSEGYLSYERMQEVLDGHPDHNPCLETWYLRGYYGSGEDDYAAARVVLRSTYFTGQPEGGFTGADNRVTVSFSTNFRPVKIALAHVNEKGELLSGAEHENPVLSYYSVGGTEGMDRQVEITMKPDYGSAWLAAAAWYSENQAVLSQPFRVAQRSFTAEPRSGNVNRYADDGTPQYRVTWAVCFTPLRQIIFRTDESGNPAEGEDAWQQELEPGAKEYTISMPTGAESVRSFRIRAFYGENDAEYIDSRVFHVTRPALLSWDKEISLTEGEDAMLHFTTTVTPYKVEIYRHPDTGDTPEVDPIGNYTLAGTVEPDGPSGEYTIPWASVADQDYVYRIMPYFDDGVSRSKIATVRPIRVWHQGIRIKFALGGGRESFNLWTREFIPMAPIRTMTGELTVPECRILPPDDKMFSHWVMTYDDPAAGAERNCVPGERITAAGDATLTPVWVDRVYTWVGAEYGYDIPETIPFRNERVSFFVSSAIAPYIPSDMVKYNLSPEGIATSKESPNLTIVWYEKLGENWYEYEDRQLTVLPAEEEAVWGSAYYYAQGPAAPGEYKVVFSYKGTEVLEKAFTITDADQFGVYRYFMQGSLNKKYDGRPVMFDPTDAKQFYILGDKGGVSWDDLESEGFVRYVWQMGIKKGDEVFYNELESAPVYGGKYRLVIQEQGSGGWMDAAYFPFEIESTAVICGDVTGWEETAMTLNPATGLYEFRAELSPEMNPMGVLEFYFIIDDQDYGGFPGKRIFYDEGSAGLMEGPDYSLFFLAPSGTAEYTFALDTASETLTVTNDKNLNGAFLMGFLGDYPIRMTDPRSQEPVGGEGQMDRPIDPYIFPSGTTLWAGGCVSEGEPASFMIGNRGQTRGPASVSLDTILNTETGTRGSITSGGKDFIGYDFYFCPETHQMVIKVHRFPHEINLMTWNPATKTPMTETEDYYEWSQDFSLFTIAPNSAVHDTENGIRVYDGDTLIITPPEFEGYRVSAWYFATVDTVWSDEGDRYELDDDGKPPVGHANTLVYPVENLVGSESIYLTAVYTPGSAAPVTVTFDSRGGTPVASAVIGAGDPVPEPEAPEKAGAAFTGWYTDEECAAEAKYDFLTPVTGDLTLYAGWESAGEVTVTFDSRGGTPVASVSVGSGETVPKPATPEKLGEAFTGWYTDAGCAEGSRFDFAAPVTGDLTLYAGWEIPAPNGILKLPAGLTEIGEDAFLDTAAEAAVIPATVTAITGNPFGSGLRYIYGFGGAAKELAETYGYVWVLIDAAWLAAN